MSNNPTSLESDDEQFTFREVFGLINFSILAAVSSHFQRVFNEGAR